MQIACLVQQFSCILKWQKEANASPGGCSLIQKRICSFVAQLFIAWRDFYRNAEIGYRLGKPFYLKTGIITDEEFEQLYQQMLIEMHSNDFYGMWHYMTFLATKSENDGKEK